MAGDSIEKMERDFKKNLPKFLKAFKKSELPELLEGYKEQIRRDMPEPRTLYAENLNFAVDVLEKKCERKKKNRKK